MNTAAWGTTGFTLPYPTGFFSDLNDRGTASAEGSAAYAHTDPAQVKGTCQRAGLCGQAGALNDETRRRRASPGGYVGHLLTLAHGVSARRNAIPWRVVRGLGSDALRLSAIRPRGGELWAIWTASASAFDPRRSHTRSCGRFKLCYVCSF